MDPKILFMLFYRLFGVMSSEMLKKCLNKFMDVK